MDEDLDRDLLLAATSLSDPVVQRLKKKYRCCITFRPKAGLNACRNQILAVMLPSNGIAASSSPAAPTPPTACSPAVSDRSEFVSDQGLSDPVQCLPMTGEGSPRPLTCDEQCAGCLVLQAENARLQQAEQDALARVSMLQAELQFVRSQPLDEVLEAEVSTVASTEVEDSALAAETPIASASETPPPPARARDWQVVVRGLPCSDTVTTAVLHSTFSQFCCDRLRMRADLRISVLRRLTARSGFAAGVVALHSQEDYEALFRATREHLTEADSVSVTRNQIRVHRRALGEARRMRRALVPQQRAGAAEGGAGSADHLPMHSSLRHDAPEFVPASVMLPSQAESLSCTCPTTQALHSVHHE